MSRSSSLLRGHRARNLRKRRPPLRATSLNDVSVALTSAVDITVQACLVLMSNNTPEVKGVHALRIRRAGPFVFVEAHVEVDGRTTVEKAHAIVDEVEDRVKKKFKEVDSMTIHVGMIHNKKRS